MRESKQKQSRFYFLVLPLYYDYYYVLFFLLLLCCINLVRRHSKWNDLCDPWESPTFTDNLSIVFCALNHSHHLHFHTICNVALPPCFFSVSSSVLLSSAAAACCWWWHMHYTQLCVRKKKRAHSIAAQIVLFLFNRLYSVQCRSCARFKYE